MVPTLNLPRIEPFRGVLPRNLLVRLVSDLFSFEAVFVLFLFAGRYKADPRFSFIPIDPTALFLAASIAIGIVLLFQEKIYVPGVYALGVWMVFVLYMWSSVMWSEGRTYGAQKLMLTSVINTWCLIAGAMIMANSRERVERLMRLIVMFASWLAVEVLIAWVAQGFRGRLLINAAEGERGDSYLGFGRVCGMAAIVVCAFWATRKKFDTIRITLMLLLALFGFILLIGGGRGPLISAFLPMMLIVVIGWKMSRDGKIRIMKMQIPILLALCSFILMVAYAIMRADVAVDQLATLQRFQGIISGDLHTASDLRRSTIVPNALRMIGEAPMFGQGLGSWPIRVNRADFQDHPHNMILEVLCELGLVGLALLSLTFVLTAKRVTVERLRTDPLFLAATMLAINTFLNAMTSGDLAENRNVFVMLGLMLVRLPVRDEEVDIDRDEARDEPPMPLPEDDYASYRRIRSRLVE